MTGTRFVALLALAEPCWVAPADLGGRIRELSAQISVHEIGGVAKTVEEGENYLVSLGARRVVTVAFLYEPVPLETFASAILPPQADVESVAEAVAHHRGAIVLGTLRAVHDPESALAAAEALTLTAAALADLLPAVALYWAEADLLTTPTHLYDRAVQMGPEFRPLDMWTSLRRVGDGATGAWPSLVSRGFAPFAGREIEFAPCELGPGEMALAMWALMHHLMEGGATLADGQSFDIPGAGIVKVRLAQNGGGVSLPVYRMTLEQPAAEESAV